MQAVYSAHAALVGHCSDVAILPVTGNLRVALTLYFQKHIIRYKRYTATLYTAELDGGCLLSYPVSGVHRLIYYRANRLMRWARVRDYQLRCFSNCLKGFGERGKKLLL